MRGVLANCATVVAGTAVGLFFGNLIHERFRSIAVKALGLATFVIGAQMALGTKQPLILVGSLVLGSLVGEALRIEHWLQRFGHWLKSVSGRLPWDAKAPGLKESEHDLVEGFVTASLLFCVGAMTVLGSIKDGLGDPSLLYLKATLDGIAAIALATTLGVGVGLSVISILVLQGGIALAAGSLEPVMTTAALRELSSTGGALILAIGLDLLSIKRLPVGNMLPAVVFAAVLGRFFG